MPEKDIPPRPARCYCFTSFQEVYETFARWQNEHPPVRALVAQIEFTKDHRPHIQGFVRLDKVTRYRSVAKLLGLAGKPHFENQLGTDEDSIEYCTRRTKDVDTDFSPIQFGEFSSQGKRKDLEDVYAAGLAGELAFDPSTIDIYAKCPRFFEKCYSLARPPTYRDLKVEWLYGPTGCGKTRYAYDTDPSLYRLFSEMPEWWDGYEREKTVLIDDFRGCIPINRLLQITDRYAIQVPVKCSSRWLFAEHIIITSNFPPEHFYSGPNLDALRRRIITRHLGEGEGGRECPPLDAPQSAGIVDF